MRKKMKIAMKKSNKEENVNINNEKCRNDQW